MIGRVACDGSSGWPRVGASGEHCASLYARTRVTRPLRSADRCAQRGRGTFVGHADPRTLSDELASPGQVAVNGSITPFANLMPWTLASLVGGSGDPGCSARASSHRTPGPRRSHSPGRLPQAEPAAQVGTRPVFHACARGPSDGLNGGVWGTPRPDPGCRRRRGHLVRCAC